MNRNALNGLNFQYVELPTYDYNQNLIFKKPFIEHVERVLTNNLQTFDCFGCKIENCHTHAGSKIHFGNFIEAELLFHNSYYNQAFARLTQDWIFNECLTNVSDKIYFDSQKNIKNILLIGYETYSELYLQELRERILTSYDSKIFCEYCVYETISKSLPNGSRITETTVRNLSCCEESKITVEHGDNNSVLCKENTLCIFIVPINTSLSTMDKMTAKFCELTKSKQSDLNSRHLCLITLYNENCSFFETKTNSSSTFLHPKDNRFEYFDTNSQIENFVLINTSNSFISRKCLDCFPDKNSPTPKSLTSEKPMFGVNRGSVVPMLKIGPEKFSEPINKSKHNQIINNLSKVHNLSEFLIYKHITRGDNHFQYYFETNKFLEKYYIQVSEYLKALTDKFVINDANIQTFDYLVAPRHQSNAGWVHLINKEVFQETARIMYFDVEKEYRSNIKAKYSDLISTLDNIQNSGQKFLIRFHFVDDVIQSGETFLRVKSLLTSLISIIKDQKNISFFDSIILLLNRLSSDSQNFYLGKYKNNRFFYFVDVNISPMRSYEDACTLCKLIADYHVIDKECALNHLSNICHGVIKRHEIFSPLDVYDEVHLNLNNRSYNLFEKQYLFFISHLLNERLSNKFSLNISKDEPFPVNIEKNINDIFSIFVSYFDYSNTVSVLNFLDNKQTAEKIWKIAFIKAISRPFFTYHLRIRQASFSFCIKMLHQIIFYSNAIMNDFPVVDKLYDLINGSSIVDKKNVDDIYNCIRQNCDTILLECYIFILIQTLVKACADMNANYIIRKKVFDKLLEIAKKGDKLYIKVNTLLVFLEKNKSPIEKVLNNIAYINKNLFTSNSLLHYIKKDIVLSRDLTKSLLFEYVLLKNDESDFFNSTNKVSNNVDCFIDCNNKISLNGLLYLENNTILKNILANENNLDKLIKETKTDENNGRADTLYFYETFKELWNINCNSSGMLLEKYHKCFFAYKKLKDAIKNFSYVKVSDRPDIGGLINNFFNNFLDSNSLQALVFVHDNNEKNSLFQFFTIVGDPALETMELINCKYRGLKITQAFFHDQNLEAIRKELSHISTDVFFIQNNLVDDSQSKSIIICFNEERSINSKNQNNNPDKSLYIQIWGFNSKDYLHWFALKLFLTLRNDFIKLINEVNLQGLIEERKVEMQKAALSINKATTHAQAQKYFKHKIYDQIDDEDIKTIKVSRKTTRQQYKEVIALPNKDFGFVIYDTYYQLLSDEFISSLYRKIVRQEKGLFERDGNKLEYRDLACIVMERFTKTEKCDYQEVSNNKFNSELYLSDVGKKISLSFEFNFSEKSGCMKHNNWKRPTSFDPIINIINLMAMNVMQHRVNVDSENKLTIKFLDSGITFSNKIKKESKESIVNHVDMYTKIPPWLFGNNSSFQGQNNGNHITLWTLLKSGTMEDNNDSVTVKIDITESEFIVTLNLFKN